MLGSSPLPLPNPVSLGVNCSVAADPRGAVSNPGRVNQVNHVSSPIVSVGFSRWCAIMHLPSYSLMRSVWSSLEPGGVSCLKVLPNAGSTNACSSICLETN